MIVSVIYDVLFQRQFLSEFVVARGLKYESQTVQNCALTSKHLKIYF